MPKTQDARDEKNELLASIIISTFNRCDALVETLVALGQQTIPPEQYEIIVVDDGSADDSYNVASGIKLPCGLRVIRHDANRGVSAGRNSAMKKARGRYLILVSDDLIVPKNFIATHLNTHERFPGFWVVGGFEQLPSLTESPFGRYLDHLEKHYEEMRKADELAPGIWEMTWPTARNLSLPRYDYERIGPFDERFRTTCEDQDWTHRARDLEIRFLYNSSITCLHNDQAGDLVRHCRFQMRGAHDTALLCAKYPELHGGAEIARVNGYLSAKDRPTLAIKKMIKMALATRLLTSVFEKLISLGEKARLSDPTLWGLYRMLIGVYIFRGWRAGLAKLERDAEELHGQSLGYHSNL